MEMIAEEKKIVNRHLAYFEKIAERRHKQRNRHRYYWKDISEYCDYFIHENDTVLEIGCGTGELLAEVKGREKTGIDISPKMIEKAREQYPQINFEIMEAEDIRFDKKFDVVIISNLIGYLEDIQHVFSQIKKVCHPQTKVLVTYYNFLWEPFLNLASSVGLKEKMPAQNWLSRHDIDNFLYLAGFDVYRNSMRLLIPFYIPLISTLFNKYIAKLPLIRHFCLNMFSFARPMPAGEDEGFTTSVVIPARNESGNIENAVLRLPSFGKGVEIIFVEGNSTDDTWEKIKEVQAKYGFTHNIKIARQPGKGKADAVRTGFEIATGDILMILDADLTVPPEDIPKFYEAIATRRGEFINGCRLVYAMDDKAMRFLNLLGNKFFSIVFTYLLGQPFKDTLCGTKVMFRKDYEKLKINRKFFGDFDPFGDFDLLFGAYKLNLRMVELPIRYKERTYGETNISRFRHGFILLKMCAFAARKVKFI